ncbi:MAG TPA: hypothetical protein VFQ00_01140 [Terriglobales bacterium]|nr:hypothetical protein [Terriglobales bacterium]
MAGASADTQKAARHSMPGGERKMRGCLLKDDSGFILQNTRGRKVKLDTTADLSSDLNHEVRLHGTFVDATPDTPAAGSHSAPPDDPADREFHVVKLDTLAQSCTESQSAKRHRP